MINANIILEELDKTKPGCYTLILMSPHQAKTLPITQIRKTAETKMTRIKLQDNSETFKAAKNFLNTTLRKVMLLLEAECGSFFLLDQEKKELVLDSFLNSRPINIKNIKRKVGEGISGKVAELNAPVLVRDIDHDIRFRRNGFHHYHTKSFISIPLFCSEELFGLINIADKATGEAFSEKDLQFAVTLCKYACMVVENMLESDKLVEAKENLSKQKALLEKYATVGKLAAGIVHEVNNPLDGVIRYTNILLNQIEEHSITQEYLLEIKKGLSRIGNITKSLLEFSHIINSDSAKTTKYVSLYDIIDESLQVLKEKINGNIRIVKRYETMLPRITDMGISHVLVNLIKNAIDAMPKGGTLEISTEMKDAVIYIRFKDTGTGIPLEVKKRLFEPFFTTKPLGKGTGLGLAISQEIVKKYEGTIEVESMQQFGSTFTVLIPTKHLENGK